MKALKKAEHTQKGSLNLGAKNVATPDDELTLAPMTPPHGAPHVTPPKPNSTTSNALPKQAAANLFHAKQHQDKSWLAFIAAIGAVLIAGGGIYMYFQLRAPASITPLTPPMPPVTQNNAPIVLPHAATQEPEARPAAQTTGPLLSEMEERQKMQINASKSNPATHGEDAIKITQESSSNVVNPTLANAYQSLNEGHIDLALSQYQKLLITEPNNTDALLGLAAITAKQGKTEQSAKYYVRVLELDPKNSAAQAGLIAFMGKTDPASSESRLKQLLQNQPAAFLFFALGNLYGGQSQWSPAEQAYFQAFQMEPRNPDYAFNLAVSLEHINQSRPALTYYQQALKLAQGNSNIHFDKRAAQERISQLSSSAPHDTEDAK